MSNQPREVLEKVFGYREFRLCQEEAINAVLSGEHCLVIMPTGGGKSVIYQVPSLILEGTTIVVSPLIALMKDQVDGLLQLGVRAAFLNSSLYPHETASVEERFLKGELDILYLAPERLNREDARELLLKGNVSLFAIDEAHCVSQWGHDFRPDYLELSTIADHFSKVPRIALTATADDPTRADIQRVLKIPACSTFITGFDRPNIAYAVQPKQNPKQQLLSFLRGDFENEAGIVYCLSRKKVEETAEWLSDQGRIALPYHAGLPQRDRDRNQERFLQEEDVIIVATIAFGMGIDKPNVRFVAHLDLPKSIEAYSQETGRAGRDGLPAAAWMAYGMQDIVLRRQMIADSEADEQTKMLEQRKLGALIGYAETTECRRKVLLQYFGESFDPPCGSCDICIHGVETWDGTEAAQKAISAAYRTGQRFGVNYLIDLLRGQSDERMARFGHDQLVTFGVGRDLSKVQWQSVFRQLVSSGFLKVDMANYGSVKLTAESKKILRGESELRLRNDILKTREPRRTRKASSADVSFSSELDKRLFESLRAKRLQIAKAQGVPPYVIFHDKTLRMMAVKKPTQLEMLGEINGVGEKKLERYGSLFLEVIANNIETENHVASEH